jgi:HPt (histidine-containing phosphotransfer) domain-containing protein
MTEHVLYSELAGDPDMLALIDLFLAEIPDRLAALRAAFHSGNDPLLNRLSHQLRGAGGGYGYPAISDAAAGLESVLEAGFAAEEIEAHLGYLEAVCLAAFAARPVGSA